MNGSSLHVTLTLTAYQDIDSSKNVFFAVICLMYIACIVTNISLILLIYLDTSLHKPIYIFLFSLIVNGLIGSACFWPKVMAILVTGVNTISYVECFLQIFFNATYGVCTYTILTVMAYDRLVSIFQPLQYHTIMTPQKVRHLLLVADFVPMLCVIGQVCLTSRIPLCQHTLHRITCDNLSLSRLSCGDSIHSRVANLYGLCVVFALVFLPLFLIVLSYIKIIKLILNASGKARQKTFETCSPHIIVFINFSLASLFSVIYNRVNPYLPSEINIIQTLNFSLVPPLLHPIIYGIKNQEIRHSVLKMWKRNFRII